MVSARPVKSKCISYSCSSELSHAGAPTQSDLSCCQLVLRDAPRSSSGVSGRELRSKTYGHAFLPLHSSPGVKRLHGLPMVVGLKGKQETRAAGSENRGRATLTDSRYHRAALTRVPNGGEIGADF